MRFMYKTMVENVFYTDLDFQNSEFCKYGIEEKKVDSEELIKFKKEHPEFKVIREINVDDKSVFLCGKKKLLSKKLKWIVNYNGKEGKEFKEIGIINLISNKPTYIAKDGEMYLIHGKRKATNGYEKITSYEFTPIEKERHINLVKLVLSNPYETAHYMRYKAERKVIEKKDYEKLLNDKNSVDVMIKKYKFSKK
jgi:hypothetical protein